MFNKIKNILDDYLLFFKNKICYIYWYVKYRTIDKYHVINSGLPPGYHETPELILHVNFNLLVKYVENELKFNIIEFNNDDVDADNLEIEKEILYLYNWWKNYKKTIDSEYEKLYSKYPEQLNLDKLNDDKLKDDNFIEEFIKINKMEVELRNIEDENLIRLIKIRHNLWT